MPAQVPNGVEITQTILQENGDIAVNVLHFRGDQALTPEDMADVDEWFTGATALYRAHMNSDATLVNVRIADMSTNPWTIRDFPHDQTGGGSSSALPAQLAVVSSLQTGTAGRRGRGRIYWAAFSVEALSVSSAVVDGVRDDLQVVVENLVNGFVESGGNYSLGVWSRLDGEIRQVIGWLTDSRFDVQRRRANRRVV